MDKDFFNLNYRKSALQINEEENKKNYIKNIVVAIIVLICGIVYVTRPGDKKIEMHIKDNTVPNVVIESISNGPDIEEEKLEAEEVNQDTKKQLASYEIKADEDKNIQSKISEEKQKVNSLLININTASSKELEKINGIGPAIAKNIIEYRTKHGGFAHKEEIKNVKRVGAKLYDKIKDYISVD